MTQKPGRLALVCFIVLFISLVVVTVPTEHRPFMVRAVLADWWDANFFYRKQFNISTGGATFTDIQINITIYRSTGTDGDWKVYVGTKCEADYDDIRFTDDNKNLLSYWIQDSDSSSALVWVELDSVDANGETFYMYYGYSSASAYSNGEKTFQFFDDFNDGNGLNDFNTSKWTKGTGATWGGNIYEEGGWLILNNTTMRSTIWSDVQFGGDNSLHFLAWFKDVRAMGFAVNGTDGALDGTKDCAYFKTETSDSLRVENNGVGNDNPVPLIEQDTHELEIRWDLGIEVEGLVNGVSKATDNTDIPDSTPDMVAFFYIYNGDAWEYFKMTWCFVRQYQNGQPVFDGWGSEETANEPPTNSATPVCTNIDDTNNLYARYKKYEITSQVTDPDGYADIDYVELSFMQISTLTTYWKIRFDEDTDTFTEETNPTYIELDTTGSSASKSGTTIDITWKLYIEWIHPDVTNRELRQYVIDSTSNTDTDDYEVDWDVETRLDGNFILNDGVGTTDRGTIDGGITASGVFYYYGGGGNDYAPSDEVDVWISCAAVATSPWSDTILTDGAYSMTVQADDEIGQDLYTVKPVAEGAGSAGTSLFYTSDLTDTYIADQVKVVLYSVPSGDTRVNINDNVYIRFQIVYDYDELNVTDGSVTVNGVSATYESDTGYWGITVSQASVQAFTYNTVACSGNTHGVNSVNQNGQSQQVIWDRIQVQSYTVSDARVNINDNVNIDALLWYDYDDTLVTDGTVTINGYSATHQGSGVWRITRTSTFVGNDVYDEVQCTGNTYGITVEDQNGQSQNVIWDRIIVVDLTYGGDTRINAGTSVNFDYELHYEYDATDVTDGNVQSAGYTFTHQGSGIWRYTTDNGGAVGYLHFDTVVCWGNQYGITVENQNGKSVTLIWDRIQVQSYTVSDARVNINDNVNIDALLWYDYDDTLVTDGTVTINGYSATHQGSGVWRITRTSASVGDETYNNVQCTGNTYGITVEDQNGKSTMVIWDRIVVTITNTNYYKLPLNVNASQNGSPVTVTAIYDYDDTLFDGTVTLNSTTWLYTTAGWRGYTTASVSGGTHGITAFTSTEISILWQDVSVSWNHFWSQYNEDAFAHMSATKMKWSVENSYIPATSLVDFIRNSSTIYTGSPTNGQITSIVCLFDTTWFYVYFKLNITYTDAPYYFNDYQFIIVGDDVPTWHTLYIEVFDHGLTDYYFSFYVETNWHNACITVFLDGAKEVFFTSEGWHQFSKPTMLGVHNITILVNGTGPAIEANQYYGLGDGDGWDYRWTLIEVEAETTLYFYFYDLNVEPIPWGYDEQPFVVWVNGTEVPCQGYWVRQDFAAINLTIVDHWGYTLYTNASYPVETTGDTVIRITLTMWRIWLVNQKDFAVYARVVFNNVNRTFYIGKAGIQGPINVYSSTYTVHWYEQDSGTYINSETVTLTSNHVFFTPRQPDEGRPGGPGIDDDFKDQVVYNQQTLMMTLLGLGLVVIFIIVALALGFAYMSGKITELRGGG